MHEKTQKNFLKTLFNIYIKKNIKLLINTIL